MAYTTINKSTDYFNTKLYTGNGSTNAQTGVGFQPDWLWFKNRVDTYNHHVFDVLRGVNQQLQIDSTGAESTYATSMTSFDSDGFTLGANNNINYNGNNHVAWCWKAGGSGSANTDGSINTTSTSVSTTSGFSISTYTGTGSAATIGHGLGATPDFIIVKNRSDSGESWMVWTNAIAANKYLLLNTTGAEATDTTIWNNTLPTSSVFSVGTHDTVNKSGSNYVAYCFTNIKGFSKFGSYVGNGNADGPIIYTGFKPAFILTKNAGSSSDWILNDNKRLGYNPNNYRIKANTSGAEQTVTHVDLLSNGFKVRTTSTDHNTSGNTIIYMSFAEAPLVGSNNIPATAR